MNENLVDSIPAAFCFLGRVRTYLESQPQQYPIGRAIRIVTNARVKLLDEALCVYDETDLEAS